MVSRVELEKVFNQTLQEVTDQIGGIHLYQGGEAPQGDLCTVYASFEKGFHSSLSLCADKAMFIRLTQNMMQEEDISPEDMEDFSKEYFNVVCGHIAVELFHATKVPSRFGLPSFYSGRYQPEDEKEQFVLSYCSDQSEGAQLTHLTSAND